MPNQRVAEMERLHHSTVKDLDKLYMQKQIELAGLPAPRAIGIDEISIRKGPNYRVIVSDLERGRPIWVGGEGRKEVDLDLFFQALGEKKSARIELAAMDIRLEPYRKFAKLIESHWDGIASYCHPENKVSLGWVEGINNKIRVLQRRAYGYRDEEYLKLKIVAAFLPPLPINVNINPHESA